jgi:hypothetical protein
VKVPSAPGYPKEHFSEGSETAPACPSDIASIKVKMNMYGISGMLLTGEKTRYTRRESCHCTILFTINITLTGRGSNPVLSGKFCDFLPETWHGL